MNQHAVEKLQIQPAFLPVNMQLGANNGDWFNLKFYQRCAVVFIKGAGTAGDDPTITILQAKDVSGGSSKALTISRVDKKQAVTDLTSIGTYTKSTALVPATNDTFSTDTWTNSDLAEQTAIVVIDIAATDLDIANGFCTIQANIADIGTHSQLGTVIYIGHDPRYPKETLDSAIA